MVGSPFAVRPPFCRAPDTQPPDAHLDSPDALRAEIPPGLLSRAIPGRVSRVYDGDTIAATTAAGLVHVRLIGIDAPEIMTANAEPQPGAIASHNALSLLVLGMHVLIITSDHQPPTDAYNRLIAYLVRQPDGLLVNLEMLRQGWAIVPCGFPHELKPVFIRAGAWARTMRLNLWA